MKLAYFVLPHLGGTYTVFKNLRNGLAGYGIDLQWLGVCSEGYTLSDVLAPEASFGALVPVPADLTESACGQRVATAIGNKGFDGIIVNVLGDQIQTNIARYLPENIIRLMVVHNITPGTYAAAKAVRDHIHATICVAERSRIDLIERYGFPRARIHTIFNAVEVSSFEHRQRLPRSVTAPIRLLFAGRIEDASKGVFWLREILDGLPETITLTVVGDGPDMAKLNRRLGTHKDRVVFAGAVPASLVSGYMAEHDILIMPSRYEGLPMTLIEAMAAGCVPVVSEIKGVTDTIVEDGLNGMLFPVGNYMAASRAIMKLDADRELLRSMSRSARETVTNHHGVQEMAERYNDVLNSLKVGRPKLAPPLDIEAWEIPRGLQPGLRTYIPLPLKNWLRVMRERC